MNMNMTLLGQSVAFAIFVWFCMKYVWPPISEAMRERQKKIAEGLDSASRAQRDLELAQEKAAQTLREAKEESARILEQANKRSTLLIEEAKEQAKAEGERLVEAAKGEINQEVNRAKDELRGQMSSLILEGAEKILESSVDEKAHSELVDKLAKQL
ncbi:F0F1 ATP synthase subunit B [Marinospirillum sp.]|uniref:F0F1 ATP synthase subunit B n=1 Tax=Marinospirillum sp. TaxID=2183934 RepID=UPI002870175D|nr:F0F1 ATP synthase subunit B [Marinospirillum sp.]MDR9466932.1 F0F1 ATP synthase subunit B [Marinospirillum sp.]